MKLIGQGVERKGENVIVKGTFTNKWRKPTSLRLVIDDSPNVSDVIIEGDIKESMEALNCIAEIAWNSGWRPNGLPNAIMGTITNFKIPKA